MSLLVLLVVRAVRGAFTGILVPLCLALGAVKNCPDRLLALGVADGDVEELLGGLWALASQLVNQGLVGCNTPVLSIAFGIGIS